MNPASPLARLFAVTIRPGVVTWIGLRPVRRAPVRQVEAAEVAIGGGLVGDHYHGSARGGPGDSSRGQRQVTLIGAEALGSIASYLGLDGLDPALLRRNLVTRGINLHALKGARFRIGSATLQATGECHPCSRMEEILGEGGYNAVRGHGGITARVLSGGEIRVGDAVCRLPAEEVAR